ncbi:mediator of RNA polymerase II transcription subunit 32-like [Telopea speciosissima]|uniref:mediator of RNA polymerase II transcription subunit 32-like n=1 Tax=Telopea speciosissima TaxID=54955 RepID=UPI001CC6C76F|nr:mediator of RNA polymerase II transcription subunit 32-like [Telopea speciosissima]
MTLGFVGRNIAWPLTLNLVICLYKQVACHLMDSTTDALAKAYQEFVAAAAGVLEANEANEASGGQKTVTTDAALENFKQRWELFRVVCDQAEKFVEFEKQRICTEWLVDETTGAVAGKTGQGTSTGLGSGNTSAAAHSHSSVPFDTTFSEEAPQ